MEMIFPVSVLLKNFHSSSSQNAETRSAVGDSHSTPRCVTIAPDFTGSWHDSIRCSIDRRWVIQGLCAIPSISSQVFLPLTDIKDLRIELIHDLHHKISGLLLKDRPDGKIQRDIKPKARKLLA